LDQYTAVFPNLKSIWAYVGYSPSAATGSIKHIQSWAKASAGPMDAGTMDEAREDIAGQSGKRDQNIALWTRDGDQESYRTASPYAKKDYPTMRAAVDSDMGQYQVAYQSGQIDLEALSALYTNLQNLVGSFRGELGEEAASYELAMKHVLYLRHWHNISKHFMEVHGALIQGAYADASVDMPDFASMSRDQTLAAIAAYPGDPGSEVFVLLRDTLKSLNPELIPDTWI
ncbi:MAG: hypothetical protein VX938_13730, partial [Myxococcota bacterium]|nr:hypothetical protein [Myxococcota bacterium]